MLRPPGVAEEEKASHSGAATRHKESKSKDNHATKTRNDDVLQVRTNRTLLSRLRDAERVVVAERSERGTFFLSHCYRDDDY